MIIDTAGFTTWATMRPKVLRKAPECPSFLIDDALKEAANQFFSDSRVWRTAHGTLLTTVADTAVYAYTPPTNAQVWQVQTAWIGTDELTPVEAGDEADDEPGDADELPRIFARMVNKIVLTPLPANADVDVEGTLSLRPSTDAAGIPQEAWDRWADEIACGAASILVAEPNKPWSNPGAQSFLRGVFMDGISSASNSAGPTRRVPLRVRAL